MTAHPDIFDAPSAVAYLRLDAACASADAARRKLSALVKAGEIHPWRIGKADLFLVPDLNAYVQREIARLTGQSVCITGTNPAPDHQQGEISMNGHKEGHSDHA